MKCEKKVAMICRKYGLAYRMQPLKFGYERAEIEFDNYALQEGVREKLHRIRGVSVDSAAHFRGQFRGRLTVMDKQDAEELAEKLRKEQARIEDWWQRYHVADEETRRRMACGAIA